MERKDIFDIAKIGAILCAITAISAGILAFINDLTAPVIAANNEKKRDAAMMRVLPDATGFEKLDFEGDELVTEIYSGGDAGMVVLCEPKGYGGAISMVVGIDAEGKVSGIDITGQSETPGLGANCVNDDFKGQFTGKNGELKVAKNASKADEIDAISSATITSKAVTKGVNAALRAAAEHKGGAN